MKKYDYIKCNELKNYDDYDIVKIIPGEEVDMAVVVKEIVSIQEEYLKLIKEKGEFDFEVSAKVMKLSKLEYEELKSMLITAIGTMEEMRRMNLESQV